MRCLMKEGQKIMTLTRYLMLAVSTGLQRYGNCTEVYNQDHGSAHRSDPGLLETTPRNAT